MKGMMQRIKNISDGGIVSGVKMSARTTTHGKPCHTCKNPYAPHGIVKNAGLYNQYILWYCSELCYPELSPPYPKNGNKND